MPEAAKEKRPRLVRPKQDQHREALDHQGGGHDRFAPERSAMMGVRRRLPMLHTEMRLRIIDAATSVRPCSTARGTT